MPKTKEITTKASEPEKVDAYMSKLKHPLAQVVEDLRQIILSMDGEIGEAIKWNAPSFFYAGKMKPTNPKEYKRYIVVFNFVQKRLHPAGISEGSESQGYVRATGRRLRGWKKTGDVL